MPTQCLGAAECSRGNVRGRSLSAITGWGRSGSDATRAVRPSPSASLSPCPRDAEALVLDFSFRGTKTAQLLADTGVPVEWHAGFTLAPEEVDAEFRGPVMVPLAARICRSYAREGILNAEALGHAAASVVGEPEAWTEWGSQDEVLQYVKQLWHVLVRYGRGLDDV
ncbi:DUF3626 domain-containing protein [Streptomyces sp. NPDC002994]|uniref:DUF3626 domain-containing protein n=1 Tax=Streptomyces sp. NPDC002994 TaxID=3154441 RepID=UPI0033ABD13F